LSVCQKVPDGTDVEVAMLIVEMVSVVLPVFVRVTVCEALVVPTFWLPKLRLDGVRVTDPKPVPESPTVWGLFGALSVMVTTPVRVPGVEGVKVTLIEQPAPAATLVPQLVVSVKSPLAEILEMLSGALPEWVRVTVCGALDGPTGGERKVNLAGGSVRAGRGPARETATVCGCSRHCP